MIGQPFFCMNKRGIAAMGPMALFRFLRRRFCWQFCVPDGFPINLFGAKRGPVNVLFSMGMLVSYIFLLVHSSGYLWLDSMAIFLIGFTVFGPQMLIGVAAAELSHKKAAATSTGFAGCFAYIGAAIAGYPLGKITQDLAGMAFFCLLSSAVLFLSCCCCPMWDVKAIRLKLKSLSCSRFADNVDVAVRQLIA